jgi:hypothetical protein
MPIANGYLKLVVSAGGNAKSGSVLVYLDESG